MAEKVLRRNSIMQSGDILRYSDGYSMVVDGSGVGKKVNYFYLGKGDRVVRPLPEARKTPRKSTKKVSATRNKRMDESRPFYCNAVGVLSCHCVCCFGFGWCRHDGRPSPVR